MSDERCAVRCHEEDEGNLLQLMKVISESDSKVILNLISGLSHA